jgi:hypothetical protein
LTVTTANDHTISKPIGASETAVSIAGAPVRLAARGGSKMTFNVLLWVVQVLLALLFLFAGGLKLVLPADALAGPIALPILFLRFIGFAEVLGALGLILPGVTGFRRELTPIAGAGLIIIMIGATVISAMGGGAAAAVTPFVTGALVTAVAVGRAGWVSTIPALHFRSTSA